MVVNILSITPLSTTGTVTEDNVNYRNFPHVDPSTLCGSLNKGDTLQIDAEGITDGIPASWYRFKLNGEEYWVDKEYVALPEQPSETGAADNTTILNQRGIRLTSGDALDDTSTQDLTARLQNYGLYLAKGVYTAAELLTLRDTLSLLADLGIALTSDTSGWALEEIMLVRNGVNQIADRILKLFQSKLGAAFTDRAAAFRVLYAPLRIKRTDRQNISPEPAMSMWYSANWDGYNIEFGNLTFRAHSSHFKPVELVIHEIEHVINWRYQLMNDNQLVMPEKFYRHWDAYILPAAKSGTGKDEIVHFVRSNNGFSTNPRSSDQDLELVTDLLTNAVVGYSNDLQGRARAEEEIALMQGVLKQRVKTYAAWGDNNLPRAGHDLLKTLLDAHLGDDQSLCTNLTPQFGD